MPRKLVLAACLSLRAVCAAQGSVAGREDPPAAIMQPESVESPAARPQQPGGQPVQQTVTVTADRALPGVEDRATSTTVLSPKQRLAAPGLGLDDALHQTTGFQLFRRTSSWTANPTTEGISLRGLGATAASRTLVESDDIPVNDPFGGWIHWDEIPQLAAGDVVLVRGGAANLYGSSAIGGVVAIVPLTPERHQPLHLAFNGVGATQNSGGGDGLLMSSWLRTDVLLAGSGLKTEGFIPVAPVKRGRADTPAGVAEESGRAEMRWGLGAAQSAQVSANAARASVFLRGNVLNEERQNGTRVQTNATRLWRMVGGGDFDAEGTHAALRAFGAREGYRQGFSSVSSDRSTESVTRLQRVPADEFGFLLNGSRPLGSAFVAALGMDLRDIRATDTETPVSRGVPGTPVTTSARQRELGGYGEIAATWRGWSATGSVRGDSFRTFDAVSWVGNTATTQPVREELVASPRLGVVRQLPGGIALSANAFRAFRGPTLNELYRTGQVGQQTTLANASLKAERATGFEAGAELAEFHVHGRSVGRVRASYFWTEVNRPISAVLQSTSANSETLRRENLGQQRSRGVSVEASTAAWHSFTAQGGWQLAVATVTAYGAGAAGQRSLVGKWLPEVPRNMATAAVHWSRPDHGAVHLLVSYTGRTFDDTENRYVLHPYARFDASAEYPLWHRLAVYGGAQNLLNRTIEAGRTPVLTLASPRLVQGGLRWQFSR